MNVGYLGPAGTFTHQAALHFHNKEHEVLMPFSTIGLVLGAIAEGSILEGVVPITNSTEGVVNATIDSLIFDYDLFIQKKITMPISQHLMAKNKNNDPLTKILSHPQALSQCNHYLQKHYGHCEIVPVMTSTAEAARLVAKSNENWGSIGPRLAAELNGLTILKENIQDEDHNETTFVLVSKNDTSHLTQGCTTTIAFTTQNKPGELYKILDIFSLWDVNMTSIVSRPMAKRKGEYVFIVDLEVSDNLKDVTDALTMVKRKTSFFKSLGCY